MLSPEPEPLSVRQAEIAALVARGKSNREIAQALHLSQRTVETHVGAVFNKMGVRSRNELAAALLRASPLRSVGVIPNNLPRTLTSFIGRETEIAAIGALVESHQLVTLVGSAGVGKTSTSLQVAASMLASFIDGVWFIELAPLTDGDYISAAIAQPLGLTLSIDGDPLFDIVKQIKAKCALLVFDNCEHLIDTTATAIATILRECPTVKILASSRQPLRVVGESTFRIPSLTVPSDANAARLRATDILEYEATQLFVERASAVDDRFTLTDRNATDLAEICRRLDGIPLAIELAAARIVVLSPQQLREQLDERFRILTAGSRDAIGRHQTLRALIDWSYDLLDEPERVLFRRLGVFVGGFSLDGAVAVGGGELSEISAFDALASLVENSLVLAEPTGDVLRYRLLESTHLYAVEKLMHSAERESTAHRQRCYLRDRFANLSAEYGRTGLRFDRFHFFATELANVRAAFDGPSADADVLVNAELLLHIATTWSSVGLDKEGMGRIQRALDALPDAEPRLLAGLTNSLAHLLHESGRRVRSFEIASRARKYARASGDVKTLATVLINYSRTAAGVGELALAETALMEAEALHALTVSRDLPLLYARAYVQYVSGDSDAAVRTAELILSRHRSMGDAYGGRQGAYVLAKHEFARGGVRRAAAVAKDSVLACRIEGNFMLRYLLLILAASLAYNNDDLVAAAAAAREAVELWANVYSDDRITATAILIQAFIWALRGGLRRAAVLAGFAADVFERDGSLLERYESMVYARLASILRDGLHQNELERLTVCGAALAPEEAIALALAVPEPELRDCGDAQAIVVQSNFGAVSIANPEQAVVVTGDERSWPASALKLPKGTSEHRMVIDEDA